MRHDIDTWGVPPSLQCACPESSRKSTAYPISTNGVRFVLLLGRSKCKLGRCPFETNTGFHHYLFNHLNRLVSVLTPPDNHALNRLDDFSRSLSASGSITKHQLVSQLIIELLMIRDQRITIR